MDGTANVYYLRLPDTDVKVRCKNLQWTACMTSGFLCFKYTLDLKGIVQGRWIAFRGGHWVGRHIKRGTGTSPLAEKGGLKNEQNSEIEGGSYELVL